MSLSKKLIKLFLIFIFVVSNVSALTFFNRTAYSDIYSFENGTFQSDIYAREINLLNNSGQYDSYANVTSLLSEEDYFKLVWNNKSITFSYYAIDSLGSKEYFSDKSTAEKGEINLTLSKKTLIGGYYYNHTMNSAQISKFGYQIASSNVSSCYSVNYSLICDNQRFSFDEAVYIQNLTVLVNSTNVEFEGSNLNYIDPSINLNYSGLSGVANIQVNENTGAYSYISGNCLVYPYVSSQMMIGSRITNAGSGTPFSHSGYFSFPITSLSSQWAITNTMFNFNFCGGESAFSSLKLNPLDEDDPLTWYPSTQTEFSSIWQNILNGQDYTTYYYPGSGWNFVNLGSSANSNMESYLDSGDTRFYLGIANSTSHLHNGYGIILYTDYWGLSNGPYLTVTYIVPDTTPPTTSISATSPPEGPTYSFGTNTTSEVNVILSCSDSATGGAIPSGCAVTRYCLDTTNSCTPSANYVSPFNISSKGISYIRYRSNDTAGNLESINSRQLILLNTPSNISIYVGNGLAYNQTGKFLTTENIEFSEELNGALYSCTADSDGYCTIPLTIHSDSSGQIALNDLDINFNITEYVWNAASLVNGLYKARIRSYNGQTYGSWDASDNYFGIGLNPLRLVNLSVVYQNSTQRIFKFIAENLFATSLNNLTWQLNVGSSNISSQLNSNLSNGENMLVHVFYNYSSSGNYTIRATASSGQYNYNSTINITV